MHGNGKSTDTKKVSRICLVAVGALLAMKIIAGMLTGSVGIMADAIHSAIDLSGVIIGFIGIRIAAMPPDERHAFGHGRAEDIAGAVISGLIFVAAGIIAYQAGQRLITGESLRLVDAGIYITIIAISVNVVTARYAARVARENDSTALEATANDMMADVYSSVAVLAGLLIVRITSIEMADPVAGLVVVGFIGKNAYFSMRRSLNKLMDTRLPTTEVRLIESCLTVLKEEGKIQDYHKLRTRKAGNQRYMDVHVVVPRESSVREAHELSDRCERAIEKKLGNASVTVHIEPCDGKCENCPASCDE